MPIVMPSVPTPHDEEEHACNYSFLVDKEGNPVIEAETPECKEALKKVLQERETILRVKVKEDGEPKTKATKDDPKLKT